MIVMPGGDGSAEFHPFVKRIFGHALPSDYLVAQLVAVKWTPDQRIVWPTRKSKVPKQKFPTESFVRAVIADVEKKHKLDERYIFTLSWSSGGPAAYTVSLGRNTKVTGSYIAMSVFKPRQLGSLARAKGHAYFLDHSPDDRVCPFRMAEQARDTLTENGAAAKLVTYEGGHGWRGDVFGRIRQGIAWLESRVAATAKTKKTKSKE